MHTKIRVNGLTGLVLFILLLTSLVACLPKEGEPETVTPAKETSSVPQRAAAAVEAIDIFQNNAFPVEVNVVVRGHFPNECTAVDQIRQERRGSTFLIAIDSVQYATEACIENRVAFEETIALDLTDMPAGIYVVDVNGLQGTFKLQRDNIRDDGNAVIGGLVWNDRCSLLSEGNGEEITAADDCVVLGQNRYGGDGIRSADETGIAGAMVHLGAGVCPSIGLATTLTAPDGTFLFSGLMAGDYCLTVTGDNQSDSILAGEGLWTFPDDASGQLSVSLEPGESNLDATFGWTQVISASEPVYFATPAAECTNKALFIEDVTVPDNTSVLPGETFTKTWQLQNLGSCTWDSTYSLVFAGGERLAAPDRVPLTITVPPGELGSLSVRLVAPEAPGDYQGEWKLADPDGASFGIGPGSDSPFWVKVVVIEEAAAG